jgi:hypothetical protein
MNYEEFFDEIESSGIEVQFDNPKVGGAARLSNEALFHLPLLAITVLLFAKTQRKPKVDAIGQLVGECFERTFPDFKGSSQHLGWSANLRVRTVRALMFLETAGLVSTTQGDRRIAATRLGQDVIATAMHSDTDLSNSLRAIERSYRDVSVERQIGLGFE